MTTRGDNPFANPALGAEKRASGSLHPSDDPGRDYAELAPSESERHPSSGVGGPSEPRRPGSGARQAPRRQAKSAVQDSDPMVPGEILLGDGDIEINAGLEVITIRVENIADRPIQVGSHYHFAEVNAGLDFDRSAAWGKRLNILSGGSARFEPGAAEEVELVPIRGQRIVAGLRGLCGGKLDV